MPAIVLAGLLFFFLIPTTHAVVFESGIPGVGPEGAQGAPLPTSIAKYVSFLYIFVLGMVGIAGFVSLVIWGTVWVATGIVDKKAMALESIKNTFIGIGVALTAYILLSIINPNLTVLKISPLRQPSVTPVAQPKISVPTGGPQSMADGGSCFNKNQCYPGSFCDGLSLNESGMAIGAGKCTRIQDNTWETVCAKNDNNSMSCINNPGCKYCQMPNGSTRCINKLNAYKNCTQ